MTASSASSRGVRSLSVALTTPAGTIHPDGPRRFLYHLTVVIHLDHKTVQPNCIRSRNCFIPPKNALFCIASPKQCTQLFCFIKFVYRNLSNSYSKISKISENYKFRKF